jgi:aminopeptidase N
MLCNGTNAIRGGTRPDFDRGFIQALGDIAEDDALEPAFRAQVLQLPGEADIARELSRDVDPDAIAAARNALRATIADVAGKRLGAIVDRLAGGAFSPDAASAGRRALANAALDLMVANGDADAVGRTVARYHAADNMTDRLAALAIFAASARPERVAPLQDFHDRYRDDALVLDKWLALEASVPARETLDSVRAILADPSFAASNPNRIRALVGSFAGNLTQFNRADGAGFDFLADFLIDLDRRNPQTAARLMVSFRSWRSLEPGRLAKARSALERIAQATDLSRDSRDIVTRTLA